MTGLDKITSQIQEEAEASAKERLDAANKEAEQILADAQAACKVMEQEALEKAAAEKANQDGRAHSAAEQKRKTALLQTKQEIIAEVIGKAYETLKNEDTKDKINLGKAWSARAGGQFRYYMVFREDTDLPQDAVSMSRFLEIVKAL